jgi:hypothetical protein
LPVDDRRNAQPRAALAQRVHQRADVEFGADRHEAGHCLARLERDVARSMLCHGHGHLDAGDGIERVARCQDPRAQ